ncbi:hypothetical protein D3C81_745770 [compost metagenome]|nr:Uncharacterised protein [Serratia quinivorans]
MDQPQRELIDRFIEYLRARDYVFKPTTRGPELFCALDATTYDYHSVAPLFYFWCRQHSEVCIWPLDEGWGQLMQRLPFVSREIFSPAVEPSRFVPLAGGTLALNTYRRYAPDGAGEVSTPDLSVWLEYIERLFPDASERHTVMQWLSHMFQHPEQRPSWHLMLTSDTGTGKGVLYGEVLCPLLAQQTYSLNSFSKLTEKHSTILTDSMLILLDDVKTSNDGQATLLKSILSEETQQIRPLYGDARMERCYTRIILASNEHRPMKLDANERRWYAPRFMEHRTSREDTQQFIGDRLIPWLCSGGLELVFQWFMVYDLSGFNHKYVPQSPALLDMIDASVTTLEQAVDDFLTENRVFTFATFQGSFEEYRKDDLAKKILTERGYISKRPYQKRENPVTGVCSQEKYWMPGDFSPEDAREWLAGRSANPSF